MELPTPGKPEKKKGEERKSSAVSFKVTSKSGCERKSTSASSVVRGGSVAKAHKRAK